MDSIRVIRVLSVAIMFAAASVSFKTQQAIFLVWGCDTYTSTIAPVALDLLAIICTLAIHAPNVSPKGLKAAIVVLVITAGSSTVANAIAGDSWGSRAVHGGMVILYVLAEWIAAQVKTAPPAVDPKRSEAAKRGAAKRKMNAVKRTRKPRAPKVATTVAEMEELLQDA
jgi:hypothetical protein